MSLLKSMGRIDLKMGCVMPLNRFDLVFWAGGGLHRQSGLVLLYSLLYKSH